MHYSLVCVSAERYLGRNVDRLQSLSSTLVGVLSLVGVSAEFGSHRLVRVVW